MANRPLRGRSGPIRMLRIAPSSPDADFVTGQVFNVDGGNHAH